MSETLQQWQLEKLMKRPGGKSLVLGVAGRVVMAVVLFALCWVAVGWARAEAGTPEGYFHVSSRCTRGWSDEDYGCSGSLRTSPGGHLLTRYTSLFGVDHAVGSTIAVRYDPQFDLTTDTSMAPWLAGRDGLIAVSLGVGGLMALVNVVRRIRPDLSWLRPMTKKWGWLCGTGSSIIGLCAVASLVCALVAY